jgi:hypothetical protein
LLVTEELPLGRGTGIIITFVVALVETDEPPLGRGMMIKSVVALVTRDEPPLGRGMMTIFEVALVTMDESPLGEKVADQPGAEVG